MNKNGYQSGFSLIELVLAIVIIAISAAYYLKEVRRPVREAYSTLIKYQAGIFTRNVNALRSLSSTNTHAYVEHQGTRIFFNEYGWPANTAASMSPHSSNQTAEECLQLWRGIFQNPLKASAPILAIKSQDLKGDAQYKIYSKNGSTCRYQLVGNEDARYFFDYDLKTGAVVASTNRDK